MNLDEQIRLYYDRNGLSDAEVDALAAAARPRHSWNRPLWISSCLTAAAVLLVVAAWRPERDTPPAPTLRVAAPATQGRAPEADESPLVNADEPTEPGALERDAEQRIVKHSVPLPETGSRQPDPCGRGSIDLSVMAVGRDNCRVFAGETDLGIAPFFRREAPGGDCALRISCPDGFDWHKGASTSAGDSITVIVRTDGTVRFNEWRAMTSLTVTTGPFPLMLDVYIDNRHVGTTPIHLTQLGPGRHVVRVAFPDGTDHEEVVDLAQGAEVRVAVDVSRFRVEELAETIGYEPKPAPRSMAEKLYGAGAAALKQGELNRAIGQLHACLDVDPGHGLCARALGIAYAKLGNGPEAYRWYTEYLRLDPDAKDADAVTLLIRQYEKNR